MEVAKERGGAGKSLKGARWWARPSLYFSKKEEGMVSIEVCSFGMSFQMNLIFGRSNWSN